MKILPYFMQNKEWFEVVLELPDGVNSLEEAFRLDNEAIEEDFKVIVLTEKGKSIPEVVESYEKCKQREINDYEKSGVIY